ncbi:MAG: hypothetical protein GXO26_04680, partial [Crenarchaeota archaeon]|nr:hypothetical protein [Thermoproteota archaeon]
MRPISLLILLILLIGLSSICIANAYITSSKNTTVAKARALGFIVERSYGHKIVRTTRAESNNFNYLTINWIKVEDLSQGDDLAHGSCILGNYVIFVGSENASITPFGIIEGNGSIEIVNKYTGEVLKTWVDNRPSRFVNCITSNGKIIVVGYEYEDDGYYHWVIYEFDKNLNVLKKVVGVRGRAWAIVRYGDYIYVGGWNVVNGTYVLRIEKRSITDLRLVKAINIYGRDWECDYPYSATIYDMAVNPVTHDIWAVGHFTDVDDLVHGIIIIVNPNLNIVKEIILNSSYVPIFLKGICFDDEGNAYVTSFYYVAKLSANGALLGVTGDSSGFKILCTSKYIYVFNFSNSAINIYVLDKNLNLINITYIAPSSIEYFGIGVGKPSLSGKNIYFAFIGVPEYSSNTAWIICSLRINVPRLLPDLVVEDVRISPANPTVLSNITVSFKICNIGYRSAREIAYLIKLNGDAIWYGIIPYLSSGSCVYREYNIGSLPKGRYTLSIIVDPDNMIPELSENNNIANLTFEVQSYRKAISITSLSVNPAVTYPHNIVTLLARLRNYESNALNVLLNLVLILPNGTKRSLGNITTTINGGSYKVVENSFSVPAVSGTYEIVVTVYIVENTIKGRTLIYQCSTSKTFTVLSIIRSLDYTHNVPIGLPIIVKINLTSPGIVKLSFLGKTYVKEGKNLVFTISTEGLNPGHYTLKITITSRTITISKSLAVNLVKSKIFLLIKELRSLEDVTLRKISDIVHTAAIETARTIVVKILSPLVYSIAKAVQNIASKELNKGKAYLKEKLKEKMKRVAPKRISLVIKTISSKLSEWRNLCDFSITGIVKMVISMIIMNVFRYEVNQIVKTIVKSLENKIGILRDAKKLENYVVSVLTNILASEIETHVLYNVYNIKHYENIVHYQFNMLLHEIERKGYNLNSQKVRLLIILISQAINEIENIYNRPLYEVNLIFIKLDPTLNELMSSLEESYTPRYILFVIPDPTWYAHVIYADVLSLLTISSALIGIPKPDPLHCPFSAPGGMCNVGAFASKLLGILGIIKEIIEELSPFIIDLGIIAGSKILINKVIKIYSSTTDIIKSVISQNSYVIKLGYRSHIETAFEEGKILIKIEPYLKYLGINGTVILIVKAVSYLNNTINATLLVTDVREGKLLYRYVSIRPGTNVYRFSYTVLKEGVHVIRAYVITIDGTTAGGYATFNVGLVNNSWFLIKNVRYRTSINNNIIITLEVCNIGTRAGVAYVTITGTNIRESTGTLSPETCTRMTLIYPAKYGNNKITLIAYNNKVLYDYYVMVINIPYHTLVLKPVLSIPKTVFKLGEIITFNITFISLNGSIVHNVPYLVKIYSPCKIYNNITKVKATCPGTWLIVIEPLTKNMLFLSNEIPIFVENQSSIIMKIYSLNSTYLLIKTLSRHNIPIPDVQISMNGQIVGYTNSSGMLLLPKPIYDYVTISARKFGYISSMITVNITKLPRFIVKRHVLECDFNCNGRLDIGDVVLLLRILVGEFHS